MPLKKRIECKITNKLPLLVSQSDISKFGAKKESNMSRPNRLFYNLRQNIQKKPLIRGMIMYSITWPVGSIVQQLYQKEELKASRILKFSLYGSCFVAPSLYGWMKFSCYLWPKTTIGSTIIKVSVKYLSIMNSN